MEDRPKIAKFLKSIDKNTKKMAKGYGGEIASPRENKGYIRLEGKEAEGITCEAGEVIELTVKAKVTEKGIRTYDGDKHYMSLDIESVEGYEDEDD